MPPIREAYLSPDVLDEVIEALISENDNDSRQALYACALVSHATLSRVQRHLFSQMTLENSGLCLDLEGVLRESPHLAKYIVLLRIKLDPTEFPEQGKALTYILYSATNLHSLYLEVLRGVVSFEHQLPNTMQIAFVTRFQTLTSLHCIRLHDLPMKYIASCGNLKDLVMESVIATSNSGAEISKYETVLGGAVPRRRCRLEHLKMKDTTGADSLIDDPSTKHPLVSLFMERLQLHMVERLLQDAQDTLKRLDFRGGRLIPSIDPLSLDLPLLQTINFRSTQLSPHLNVNYSNLSFLPFLLECGVSTSPRALKTLSIELMSLSFETLPKEPLWRRVDAALSEPRYELFSELSLTLCFTTSRKEFSEDMKREVVDGFFSSFSALSSQSKVTIKFSKETFW